MSFVQSTWRRLRGALSEEFVVRITSKSWRKNVPLVLFICPKRENSRTEGKTANNNSLLQFPLQSHSWCNECQSEYEGLNVFSSRLKKKRRETSKNGAARTRFSAAARKNDAPFLRERAGGGWRRRRCCCGTGPGKGSAGFSLCSPTKHQPPGRLIALC